MSFRLAFKQKIRFFLIKLILKYKRFESSRSIIIFSEARGGSTWLMEIMATLLPVCINWEPLHANKGVVPKSKNFGWRPFIPPTDKDPYYFELFKKIHEFRIISEWTLSNSSIKECLRAKYVLTKYVRANLLLPYLTRNFEFLHKPIFLIRHPIDSCLSQIKAFDKSEKNTVTYEVPQWINNERFIEHFPFLSKLNSKLELMVGMWCLNNLPTLDKLDSQKICVVYYYDLLLNPEEEVERILNECGFENYITNLNTVDFRKASTTDFGAGYLKSSQQQLKKNMNALDLETKDKIQKIFDYFRFKLFDAYSVEPKKEFLISNK